MQTAATQTQIDRIDTLLDANMAALFMRVRCGLRDCSGFETAYRRCPDLCIRRDVLMRQRGRLQFARDAAINREWQAQQRRERAAQRKADRIARQRVIPACPACGALDYRAAA